ncbi:glutathione synthetase [Klebsiella pneumoniae]|nr:glutathione synthetase [Klebsiella pneumoniae]
MIKLGIVMDPIATINIKKDTSFAMLLEAQRRGYELHYMEMNDLYFDQRRSPRPDAHAERRNRTTINGMTSPASRICRWRTLTSS